MFGNQPHQASSSDFFYDKLAVERAKARNGLRSGNRRRVQHMVNPPQIPSNVAVNHVYRYVSSTNNPKSLNPQVLLGAIGSICIVANSVVQSIASSVKINRITIWAPPVSQGAVATTSIEWVGNIFVPDKEVSDTTMSVATPSHVTSIPPRMSTASFWQTSTTTAMCTLVAPVGAVIDINLSFILNDNGSNGYQSTVVTGTLGVLYYLALDGSNTNLYTPISMTTTH
jgi:hypothetical protein